MQSAPSLQAFRRVALQKHALSCTALVAFLGIAAPALAAGPTTQFTVSGDVTAPQTFTLSTLQALPATTVTTTYLSGATPTTASYTGATLWTLLNTTVGLRTNAAVKNDVLRNVVLATGSDSYKAVYSLGEIAPAFGGATKVDLVAYASNGAALAADGFARTVAPGDIRGGRYVSNLASLQVIHAPTQTGTFSGGVSSQFTVTGQVATPGTYTATSLQALPVSTVIAGGSTYTGVSLWTLLNNAGIITNPAIKNNILDDYVVATGSDGYQTVIALGEISPTFGNNLDLVAYAVNGGSLGANGTTRLIVPNDVKQGRWVSNLVNLEVFDTTQWVANAGEVTDLTGLTINAQGFHLNGGRLTSSFGTASLAVATARLDGGLIDSGVTVTSTAPVTQASGVSGIAGTLTAPSVAVNAGTLALVNGTVNAATTVAPGATLAGTGTINGALTFAPGAKLAIDAIPTAADRVTVNGTAALAGTVAVTAGMGTFLPQSRYTILTASGPVTGAFSGVTSNLAFLTPTLSYGANDVLLTLRRNDVAFSGVAATANQRAVANAFTAATRGVLGAQGAALVNGVSILSAQQAQAVFDNVSGEGITAAQNAAHRASSEFTAAIFDQTTVFDGNNPANSVTVGEGLPSGVLGYAPAPAAGPIHLRDKRPAAIPRTWRAWATGFGGANTIRGDAGLGTAGQTGTIYGGALGIDYQVTPDYLAGIAVGGSNGDFQVARRGTSGSTAGGHIAFYDLATFGAFYGASTASASFFTNRTNRSAFGFGGVAGETERGDFDSHEFRSRLEFGRHIEAYGAAITPFVALEIADLRSDGFRERAINGTGTLALAVSGQSAASVPSFLGARVRQTVVLSDGMVFTPLVQAAWVHEFAPQRGQLASLAALPGATFLVDGARPDRDAAQVKAGLELSLSPASALFANFDGEFSGRAQFYGGKGGFRYTW